LVVNEPQKFLIAAFHLNFTYIERDRQVLRKYNMFIQLMTHPLRLLISTCGKYVSLNTYSHKYNMIARQSTSCLVSFVTDIVKIDKLIYNLVQTVNEVISFSLSD